MTAPAVVEPAHPPSRTGYRRINRFAHRPALDGLRGLAVAGVLLFHHGIDWAVGGYLGVSAFFTLSGFLITTLLLREHDEAGGLDLRQFWLRRFRRLLPAAIAAVALALAYVAAVGDSAVLERFRLDALSALGYVANWRFVLSDLSYADLFAGDSPLQHMWSLAIEEQFYLVLPLVAALALRGPHAARRLGVVAAGGVALSVVMTLVLGDGDRDRLYYGTDTRAAELLVGVLLACLYHQLGMFRLRTGRLLTLAGGIALAAMLASWSVVEQASDWLHPWGLLVHAVLAGTVIVAAIDEGPVARALALRPLPQLGVISYGVYLYHWPIYLWLSADRTGLDGPVLLAVRLTATLVVSLASHWLLETPIRYRRTPFRWRSIGVAAGAIATCGLLVVAATAVIDRDPVIDFDAAEELADSLPSPAADGDEPPVQDPVTRDDGDDPVLPPRPRVAVFGDSTALLLVPGLVVWSEQTDELQVVEGQASLGCGIVRGGRRQGIIRMEDIPDVCSFSEAWISALERSRPDVVLVQAGIWDLVEHELPGDDTVVTLGDPAYDEYLRAELVAANDLLLEYAERVVWSLQPAPVRETRGPEDPIFDRIPEFNEMLVDLFADHPRTGLVDLAEWLEQTPDGTESLRLRPDGTHFSDETSVEVAEWLGPAVLEAATSAGVVGPADVAAVAVDR